MSTTDSPIPPSTSTGDAADRARRPAEPHDDSALESIGKAIVDPVESAAEDEEPDSRGVAPVRSGG